MPFDYELDFNRIDFRARPDLYRIGKGEQGVLLVEPYKSELLPHWRFKTPQEAQSSAETIYGLFRAYGEQRDFVGMDMARKFLQMGYTRARRYANHPSGRKYRRNPQQETDPVARRQLREHPLPQAVDWESSPKAQSARIFYGYYLKAKTDEDYLALRQDHIARYGD